MSFKLIPFFKINSRMAKKFNGDDWKMTYMGEATKRLEKTIGFNGNVLEQEPSIRTFLRNI